MAASALAKLPPLDEEKLKSADGEMWRRVKILRKLLAEGGMNAPMRNLARAELRDVLAGLKK